ncbi:hypothetical protein FQR65_LT17071 [Abscondita terminalis]|nr:hypothetical protein FQR65_LT17071 [Abscondita terminalis]
MIFLKTSDPVRESATSCPEETQGEKGTEEIIFEGTLQELEEADLNDTVVMSPASTSTNNSEPCTTGVGRKRSCSRSLTPTPKLAKDKRMELGKLIEAASMRLQAVTKLPITSDHIDAFGANTFSRLYLCEQFGKRAHPARTVRPSSPTTGVASITQKIPEDWPAWLQKSSPSVISANEVPEGNQNVEEVLENPVSASRSSILLQPMPVPNSKKAGIMGPVAKQNALIEKALTLLEPVPPVADNTPFIAKVWGEKLTALDPR